MAIEYTADELIDAPTPLFTSVAPDKATQLATARNKKLERLSGKVIPEWVDDTVPSYLDGSENGKYPKVDTADGYTEWSGNKIWNNLPANQLQYITGKAYEDTGLFPKKDDQGNTSYLTKDAEGNLVPYEGTINDKGLPDGYSILYGFGTKNNEDEIKLGTHGITGDAKDRYQGEYLYGDKNIRMEDMVGPKGVDVNEQKMGLIMPTSVVNTLERLYHGNDRAIQNRTLRNETGAQDDAYYFNQVKNEIGTGATEVYNSQLGLFGDSRTGEDFDASKLYDEFLGLSGNQRHKDVTEQPFLANYDEAMKRYDAESMDFGDRLANSVKAFGATLTKEAGVDLADWIGEFTNQWDLGTAAEKEKLVNDWFGYNEYASAPDMEKAKKLGSKITNDLMSNDKSIDISDVNTLLYLGVTNPELLGTSLGYVGSFYVPVLGWLSRGLKAYKATKAINAIMKDLKAGKITKADAKAQTKRVNEDVSLLSRSTNLLQKNAGLLQVSAGNVNDQIDEYTKLHQEPPSVGKIASMFATEAVMNTIDRRVDIGLLKKSPGAVKAMAEYVKKLPNNTYAALVTKATAQLGKLTASGAKEGAQEYVQNMGQILNVQWNFDDEGKPSLVDIVTDRKNVAEGITAAGLGAGIGVEMRGIGMARNALRPGAAKAKDATNASNPAGKAEPSPMDSVDASTISEDDMTQAHNEYRDSMIHVGKALSEGKVNKNNISTYIDALDILKDNRYALAGQTASKVAAADQIYGQIVDQLETIITENPGLRLTKQITKDLGSPADALKAKQSTLGSAPTSSEPVEDDYSDAERAIDAERIIHHIKGRDKVLPNNVEESLTSFASANGISEERYSSIVKSYESVKNESSIERRGFVTMGNQLRSMVIKKSPNVKQISRTYDRLVKFTNATAKSITALESGIEEAKQEAKKRNAQSSAIASRRAVNIITEYKGWNPETRQYDKPFDITVSFKEGKWIAHTAQAERRLTEKYNTIEGIKKELDDVNPNVKKHLGGVIDTKYLPTRKGKAAQASTQSEEIKTPNTAEPVETPVKKSVLSDNITIELDAVNRGRQQGKVKDNKDGTFTIAFNGGGKITGTEDKLIPFLQKRKAVVKTKVKKAPSKKTELADGIVEGVNKELNDVSPKVNEHLSNVTDTSPKVNEHLSNVTDTSPPPTRKGKATQASTQSEEVKTPDVIEPVEALSKKTVLSDSTAIELDLNKGGKAQGKLKDNKDGTFTLTTSNGGSITNTKDKLIPFLQKRKAVVKTAAKDTTPTQTAANNNAPTSSETPIKQVTKDLNKQIDTNDAKEAIDPEILVKWKQLTEINKLSGKELEAALDAIGLKDIKKTQVSSILKTKGISVGKKDLYEEVWQIVDAKGKNVEWDILAKFGEVTENFLRTFYKRPAEVVKFGAHKGKKRIPVAVRKINQDISAFTKVGNTTVLNTMPFESLPAALQNRAKEFAKNVYRALAKPGKWETTGTSSAEDKSRFNLHDSPARGLVYAADGTMNRPVITAMYMALGSVLFTEKANMALGGKTDVDIARTFGIETFEITNKLRIFASNHGQLRKTVAHNLGKETARLLGIAEKNGDDIGYHQYAALIADLGAMIIEAAIDNNTFETTSVKSNEYAEQFRDNKQIASDSSVTFIHLPTVQEGQYKRKIAPEIDAIIKEFESIANAFPEAVTPEQWPSTSVISDKRIAEISNKVHNGDANTTPPPEAKIALENMMRTPFTIDVPRIKSFLRDYQKNRNAVNKWLGYVEIGSPEFDKLSYEQKSVQEAINRGVERSINVLTDFLNAHPDADKEIDVYFEYFFIRNGRFMLNSNTINPQTDKLHRFLIQPKSHKLKHKVTRNKDGVTFTAKNSKGEQVDISFVTRLAIGQAFGMGIDRASLKQNIEYGNVTLALTPRQIAEVRAQILSTGEAEIVSEGNTYKIEAKHITHTLQALDFLKDAATGDTVTSSLSAEYDSLTSGFANKTQQYPILPDMDTHLARVGIITAQYKDKINSKEPGVFAPEIGTGVNDLLSAGTAIGFLDSYQNLANEVLHRLRDRTTLDESLLPDGIAAFDKLHTILPGGHSLHEDVYMVKIDKDMRDLFKNPFMIFNYSAGVNRIVKNLSAYVAENTINKMAALDLDNKEAFRPAEVELFNVMESLVQTGIKNNFGKVNSVAGLQSLIRNKASNYIMMTKRHSIAKNHHVNNLFDYLAKTTEASYGVAVKEVFEEKFSSFTEIQSITNDAFKVAFRVFDYKRVKALKSIMQANSVVTEKDHAEVLEQLWDDFPYIVGPLTGAKNKKDVITVTTTATSSPNAIDEGRKSPKTSIAGFTNKNYSKTKKVNPIIRHITETNSSGSVLPFHFIDGAEMSRMLNAFVEYAGTIKDAGVTTINDALIPSLTEVDMTGWLYNKAMYETNKDYSIIEHIAGMMKRVTLDDDLAATRNIPTDGISLNTAPDFSNITNDFNKVFKKVKEAVEDKALSVRISRMEYYKEDGTGILDQAEFGNLVSTPGSIYRAGETGPDLTYKDSIKYLYTNPSKVVVTRKKNKNKSLEKEARAHDDIMYSVVKQNIKETFSASISSNPKAGMELTDKLSLENVTYANNEVTLTAKTDNGNSLQFTFAKNNDVSMPSKSGKKLYIPGFSSTFNKVKRAYNNAVAGTDKVKVAQTAKEQLAKVYAVLKEDKTLGSLKDAEFNYDNAVQRADYIHGDIDHMKSLVRHLHILGGSKATSSELEYLESLLDKMHPSFFREMSVFIDENAETSAGWVKIDENQLLFSVNDKPSISHSGQSEAEIAVHEIIHSMTAWALRQNNLEANKLKRQLNYLFKEAMQHTKGQDLLGVTENAATDEEINRAKELYSYIFNSENADDEFLAHALTNPLFRKHLKTLKVDESNAEPTTMFDKIVKFFATAMDIILGNYNFKSRKDNVYDQVHALAFKLAELNSKTEEQIDKLSWFDKLYNMVDNVERSFYSKAQKVVKNKLNTKRPLEKLPKNATRLQTAVHHAKFFLKGMYNPIYRNAAGLYLSSLQIKPTTSIREFIRNFFTPDEISRQIEMLGLQNNKIDMTRNSYVNQAKKNVLDGFSRKLTDEEDSSITEVLLETNASHLLYSNPDVNAKAKYTMESLVPLLENYNELQKKLASAEANLTHLAGNRANWVVAQAIGLGKFMALHEGHVAQNSNADNIAKGYLTNKRYDADPALVAAIDEVASLTALSETKPELKKTVAKLLKEQTDGVQNVVNLYEAFKRQSNSTLFKKDKAHIAAGYTKEIFDDTVEVVIKPLTDRRELESAGYIFHGEIVPKNGETRGVRFGYFVSAAYTRAERLRGATNLGTVQARGTSLREMKYKESPSLGRALFERDKAVVGVAAGRLHKAMEQGTINWDKVEYGMMPTIDSRGNVVDYRYMMSKAQKKELLGQDLRVTEVLPHSMGSVIDKAERENHNQKVLELLVENMNENWDGGTLSKKGLTEYTIIGPNVTDPNMKELYYMLPRSFQEYIRSRKDKQMAVPSKDLHMLFGYKHMQLSNAPGVEKLPLVVKRILNMFGAYWTDLVKLAKGNILLKMPAVLLGNVVSNVIYAFNTGTTPKEIVQMYKESFRDVRAFMNANRRVIALDIEIQAAEANYYTVTGKDKEDLINRIKAKRNEMRRLTKEMSKNPIKELFDAGMYQSVVEDIETSKLNDTNKITEGASKLLSKTPAFMRKSLQLLYLTRETKWYQVNQEILQMSDLIARDVMNRKQQKIEQAQADGKKPLPDEFRNFMGEDFPEFKKLVGDEREQFFAIARQLRHAGLLESFVNYIKPNGRFEEYLNRIGLLMFTKFVKRIQKVNIETGARYPIKTLVTLFGANVMMDLDNIQDQAFLLKGTDNGEIDLAGIFSLYSPLDQVMNVITPALIKPELHFN